MFNNSSNVLIYPRPSGCVGIRFIAQLPQSDKCLSANKIEQKIKKAESHIAYLTEHLSHRNTHGGKRLRERNISINTQMSVVLKRIHLLKFALEQINKPQPLSKFVLDEKRLEIKYTCRIPKSLL